MLSKRFAREHGADDALWVSQDGRVLEAQTAAFFWVSSTGGLLTPPLSEGILDSITRRLVIQHLDAQERPCRCQDALSCTEAFLAGTTKEIQPVASIEGRELPLVPGPVTQLAADLYRELVAHCVAGSRVTLRGKDGRMSVKRLPASRRAIDPNKTSIGADWYAARKGWLDGGYCVTLARKPSRGY